MLLDMHAFECVGDYHTQISAVGATLAHQFSPEWEWEERKGVWVGGGRGGGGESFARDILLGYARNCGKWLRAYLPPAVGCGFDLVKEHSASYKLRDVIRVACVGMPVGQ